MLSLAHLGLDLHRELRTEKRSSRWSKRIDCHWSSAPSTWISSGLLESSLACAYKPRRFWLYGCLGGVFKNVLVQVVSGHGHLSMRHICRFCTKTSTRFYTECGLALSAQTQLADETKRRLLARQVFNLRKSEFVACFTSFHLFKKPLSFLLPLLSLSRSLSLQTIV